MRIETLYEQKRWEEVSSTVDKINALSDMIAKDAKEFFSALALAELDREVEILESLANNPLDESSVSKIH